MMSKIPKKTFYEQFKNSIILRPVVNKLWVKNHKPKACACGNVEYKDLSRMCKKQMIILQSLAESVAKMENIFCDRQKLINELLDQIYQSKAENTELKKVMEVIKNAH